MVKPGHKDRKETRLEYISDTDSEIWWLKLHAVLQHPHSVLCWSESVLLLKCIGIFTVKWGRKLEIWPQDFLTIVSRGVFVSQRGFNPQSSPLIFPCKKVIIIQFPRRDDIILGILWAQISLGSSRLDTTRLDAFDMSSPCILTVSSLSNSTARHTRQDKLDWFDRRDS